MTRCRDRRSRNDQLVTVLIDRAYRMVGRVKTPPPLRARATCPSAGAPRWPHGCFRSVID